MRAKLEVLALVLGFAGLFGTIAVTAMPMWRVSAFIGANLIIMEELWEGLWMNCWRQADIKMQCKIYDSMLILPPELQAARGFMCISIVLVIISLFIVGFGTRRSNCYNDNMRGKNITLAIGGTFYLLSCLTTLIPVSWVGHTVIRNFYNPEVTDSQKRELGEALFLGWATSGILLITGIITLFSFCRRRSKEEGPHLHAYMMSAWDDQKEKESYIDAQKMSALEDQNEKDFVHLERKSSSFYKHQEYV